MQSSIQSEKVPNEKWKKRKKKEKEKAKEREQTKMNLLKDQLVLKNSDVKSGWWKVKMVKKKNI